MKVSFVKEGAQELASRFVGTHIALKSPEGNVPIYVTNINAVKGQALFITGTYAERTTNSWNPLARLIEEDSLDYLPPAPGMINVGKNTFYFDTVPLRHRYRGLTHQQMILLSCSGKGSGAVVAKNTPEIMLSIYNPQYLPVHESLELVSKKKRNSAAFSRNFAIANIGLSRPAFVYKGIPAGLYIKEDNVALLPEVAKHLTEELSSFITCRGDT